MTETLNIIREFISIMKYEENEHVLGIIFYGSFLTGYNHKRSDIDLHIIFDNSKPQHLIRGCQYIKGIRIEYFEKPINDLYLSIDNDFLNQKNAYLSIIGKSKIILDKSGEIKKLQSYALEKYSKPLPPIEEETAKEYISIINNRMEKLRKLVEEDSPYFYHLYHLTLEKIRKFYHRLNSFPEVQTSKVFRIYTDKKYRRAFCQENMPEKKFISMYINATTDTSLNKKEKLVKVTKLFDYAKRKVVLNEEEYRIKIKSRNQ